MSIAFDLLRLVLDLFFPACHPAYTTNHPLPQVHLRPQALALPRTLFISQTSAVDPSWSTLVESPLVRLDRELPEFIRADPEPASTPTTTSAPSISTGTPHVSTSVKPTTRHEIEDCEDETTIPATVTRLLP
ncbi:hypothetical protein V8E53_006187 [Lactarius tabidus]